MSHFCKIVNNEVVLDFNGNSEYAMNTIDQFKKFVAADKENLEKLFQDIHEGLIAGANKELIDMRSGKFDSVHETAAYTRIMQHVTHFVFASAIDEENRIREEQMKNLPGPGEDF